MAWRRRGALLSWRVQLVRQPTQGLRRGVLPTLTFTRGREDALVMEGRLDLWHFYMADRHERFRHGRRKRPLSCADDVGIYLFPSIAAS